MEDRVLLSIPRWRQRPSECAIAAVTSVANFFGKKVTYPEVRKLIDKEIRKEGLYSSQQAVLLNQLGFANVTIVTADLNYFDFSWNHLTPQKMIEKIKKSIRYYARRDKDKSDYLRGILGWLQTENCNNQLKIDNDWPKYIRSHLNAGYPVLAGFNWTSTFRRRKSGGVMADITGETEAHAVILRGYNEKNVFIVDSHHRNYRGKLEKYHNGYYKLPWSQYLVNAAEGDLILVSP